MASFMGEVAVHVVTTPYAQEVCPDVYENRANFIDDHVMARLRELRLEPSPPSDDSTFLRRVTLDLTGSLPSSDEAAAFLMTYGTSYHALKDRAHLKPGDVLLILGAAGGVGSAAIEIGKAMGARVIAAASSQEKVDTAKSWGADEGLVYPRGPFDKEGTKQLADLFKSACGKAGANVVYDAIGGDYAEAALRAIAWEGRFLVVGFPAGIPKIPLNLVLLKSCDVRGVLWGAWALRDPQGQHRLMTEIGAQEKGEGQVP